MRRAVASLLLLAVLASCASSGDDGDDASGGDGTTAVGDAGGGPSPSMPTYDPTVISAECDDEVPDDPSVECGVLTVPVDRAAPQDGDVTIPYAILHARATEPLPDPIVYFSGGPGFDGRSIADFLDDIGIAGGRRDVIVFDQRGTGRSEPSLDCPEVTDAVWTMLGAAAPPIDELAVGEEALARCRTRLVEAGVDLNAYDTPTTAADAEDLRRALGIEQWNLFGVSYGTSVALEVVRRYPDAVRSVVLDSVYPPDVVQDASTVAEHARRVFEVLDDGCAADAACAGAHPDLLGEVTALVDAWNDDPYETSVTDAATGERRHVVITGDDVVAGLWNALYDSQLIGVLPSLVQPLRDRLPITDAVIEQFATDGIDQLTGGAEGITLSVDCADRQRLTGAPVEVVLDEQPFYASLLTLSGGLDCHAWDVESVSTDFNEPVASDIRALVLGDEYDPVTPPADARRASHTLTNSTYVELPGLGHGAVFADECPRSLLLAFVDRPTAELDTSCVDEMRPPAWAP